MFASAGHEIEFLMARGGSLVTFIVKCVALFTVLVGPADKKSALAPLLPRFCLSAGFGYVFSPHQFNTRSSSASSSSSLLLSSLELSDTQVYAP